MRAGRHSSHHIFKTNTPTSAPFSQVLTLPALTRHPWVCLHCSLAETVIAPVLQRAVWHVSGVRATKSVMKAATCVEALGETSQRSRCRDGEGDWVRARGQEEEGERVK